VLRELRFDHFVLQEEALRAKEQELAAMAQQVAQACERQAAAEHATMTLMPLNLTISDLRHRLAALNKDLAIAQAPPCGSCLLSHIVCKTLGADRRLQIPMCQISLQLVVACLRKRFVPLTVGPYLCRPSSARRRQRSKPRAPTPTRPARRKA
jgi:hypothetical protein